MSEPHDRGEAAPPPPQIAPAPPAEDPRVRQVELIISTLLRAGVVTSLIVIVTGTFLTFAQGRGTLSSPDDLRRILARSATFPHTPGEVAAGAATLRGEAVVVLGLVVLLATPVMRVAVSAVAFALQRDYRFVAITLVVLGLLLLSFFLGRPAH